MIEWLDPPLYFAWRWEHGMPYVVHFYVAKDYRSYRTAVQAITQMKEYFQIRGFKHILMNARLEDTKIQKAIEHHFRVKPYGQADGHQFYLVEV